MHKDEVISMPRGVEYPRISTLHFPARGAMRQNCLDYLSYKVKYNMDLARSGSSGRGPLGGQAQFLPDLACEFGGRKWRDTLAINVLVVDDEEDLRCLLVDALRANGYCASSAKDGREALEMLRFLAYDMVVLDFHMPGMDGLKLMSHIRCLYPGTLTILMTAEAVPELALEARRRGAFDVIFKPFKYTQLLSVLKRGLDCHQNSEKKRRYDRRVTE